MRKNEKSTNPEGRSSAVPEPTDPTGSHQLSLVREPRGSHRSMWEALLELRVLLPYISHLAPLLERNSRNAPGLGELSRGMELIQTGSRELENLTRNQTLQLERVEQQVIEVKEANQLTLEETRTFFAEMKAFRLWMIRITVTTAILVGATAGLVAYLLWRG